MMKYSYRHLDVPYQPIALTTKIREKHSNEDNEPDRKNPSLLYTVISNRLFMKY